MRLLRLHRLVTRDAGLPLAVIIGITAKTTHTSLPHESLINPRDYLLTRKPLL